MPCVPVVVVPVFVLSNVTVLGPASELACAGSSFASGTRPETRYPSSDQLSQNVHIALPPAALSVCHEKFCNVP